LGFTKRDYFRHPDGQPSLGATQISVDLAQKPGFLRGSSMPANMQI
jgi:hypothetical protein